MTVAPLERHTYLAQSACFYDRKLDMATALLRTVIIAVPILWIFAALADPNFASCGC